jgi:hypothetical protein
VITEAHRKELLSRAYVEVVTALCGMAWSRPEPDYGVDLILHRVGTIEGRRVQTGYPLEIQLKSTVCAEARDEEIRYDLEADAYGKLAASNVGSERILVLLVLLRGEENWTSITEAGLLLRGCAYWISLKGRPAGEQKRSVRIAIPRQNVFSPEALKEIMRRVEMGESLWTPAQN